MQTLGLIRYICIDICNQRKYNCIYIYVWGRKMAGSLKWFVYTDDRGNDFALKLDESNTEAVNGSSQDFIDGNALVNALPRNIKPRRLYYSNISRTRTISCVALTPTIYTGALTGGVPTISDPLTANADLSLVRGRGEEIRIPFAFDSGLQDGDAS